MTFITSYKRVMSVCNLAKKSNSLMFNFDLNQSINHFLVIFFIILKSVTNFLIDIIVIRKLPLKLTHSERERTGPG